MGYDYEPEPGLAANGDLEHDLQALFEAAGTAAQRAGSALVLFIDELQYVPDSQLAILVTALHRSAQRKLPITLVGAGLPQLRGQMGNSKSYAERLFEFPEFGPLTPEAATQALRKPTEIEQVRMDDAAVADILASTHRYPYFLQEWGKHAWDTAQCSPITLNDTRIAPETSPQPSIGR